MCTPGRLIIPSEYLERVAILSGPEKDVQLPAYQFRPWFLCMGEISEDADNEANRSLAHVVP